MPRGGRLPTRELGGPRVTPPRHFGGGRLCRPPICVAGAICGSCLWLHWYTGAGRAGFMGLRTEFDRPLRLSLLMRRRRPARGVGLASVLNPLAALGADGQG